MEYIEVGMISAEFILLTNQKPEAFWWQISIQIVKQSKSLCSL
jgi:hypothetical protein